MITGYPGISSRDITRLSRKKSPPGFARYRAKTRDIKQRIPGRVLSVSRGKKSYFRGISRASSRNITECYHLLLRTRRSITKRLIMRHAASTTGTVEKHPPGNLNPPLGPSRHVEQTQQSSQPALSSGSLPLAPRLRCSLGLGVGHLPPALTRLLLLLLLLLLVTCAAGQCRYVAKSAATLNA